MALSGLVDALAAQIAAEVESPPPVGSAPAVSNGDLPRITVSIEAATPAMRSVGQIPGPLETGALRVEVDIDLGDAVLHLPDEDVALLSPDRRTMQLPHGSVVRASGDDTPPFTATDLLVRVGPTTFAPVHTSPSAGQVQLEIQSGALTFADPLPAGGVIELGYFVGMWEVRVERFSSTARLSVATASQSELDALVPRIERALDPRVLPADRGIRRIEPMALGSAEQVTGLPPAARRQDLTYQIDFELVEPVIPTSGGPIRRIDVIIQPFGENFTITEAVQP